MFHIVAGDPQRGVAVSCLLLFCWLRYCLSNYSLTDLRAYKRLFDVKEWKVTIGYFYLLGLWIIIGVVDIAQHTGIRSQILASLAGGYAVTALAFAAETHFRMLERVWAWRDRRGTQRKARS